MQKDIGVNLNKAQQAVVDHKKGPLLVVAGAGTGKTRVIVEKINALLDEGVQPKALLALTFTEKAASEMLDRVLESRSGVLLNQPTMTFNGYGQSILKEFGVNIGLSSNVRLIGSQAQIVFFKERLDAFKLNYFLPLASSPDGIIEDILKLISRLKQNLVNPDAYAVFAKQLPENDEAEQLEKQKHQELAGVYQTYTTLCRQENVIDYDDQIYLAIELLKLRPNVQQQLRDRYHTIFVDEFQDTNPMQSELIDLIARDGQNLIVVGDDDQSIYGFRGATIQNILGFKNRYPKTKEIALTENYRSHQAILDASYRLIQHNNPHRLEAELSINKRLTAKTAGEAPLLKHFASTSQELAWIAHDIARRLEQKNASEPVSIAVLTRSNPTAQAVHQALDLAGIEHRVVGLNPDLYAQPVVRLLVELSRTLAEPSNNTSLHHTLVGQLFAIPNETIAPLAAKARFEHELLEDMLREVEDETINKALAAIKNLRSDAASVSIGRLLWRAVEETGYKDALLKAGVSDDQAAAAIGHLNQFFKTLKEFESIATQPTVHQYLLALPALMAAGETADDTLDMSEDEVIVTTVHKAKGLEWETVYVPYLTEASFPMYAKGKGIELPQSLRAVHESPADEHYSEERRVMYVAATRARENLIFSYADTGSGTSKRRPSRFINELFGDNVAETTPLSDEINEQTAQLEQPTTPLSKVAIPQTIYDGRRVRLSVSQAQVLLTCPLNFYYKFVLRAPEAPTTSTDYGSQLHSLFEEINLGRKNGELRPLESLLLDLETGWHKAGYSTKSQQQRAFQRAQQTLSTFYGAALENPAPKFIEHPFEVMVAEDLLLHGRLDVVFQNEDGIEIRDYKTGDSVKDEKKAKRKVSESKQLTLYALAWQLQNGEIPAKVTLQFPDTNQIASTKKQQKSIDTIQANLVKAAEDLKRGSFPAGGSQHDYCIHP